ncbi:MAG: glutamine amidotransferase [Lachnospiraceae bacterium]|nr:glutamine amidotransferase [Lachnospiraceae bacterium]
MELRICHLYPEVLNLYGDRGNTKCMQKRLEWRGIDCKIDELRIGEKRDLTQYDLFFIGGGQDFEQEVLLSDLATGKGKDICAAVEDGKVFLCICGGYQMMGHYYETHEGVKCEFLGAVDLYTVGGEKRMIGNYAYQLPEKDGGSTVVGFENHSGRTYLGDGVSPLGHVLKGYGNNGEDGTEGVHYNNVFGTYSHGPVLPKNPQFCDLLLTAALERRYGKADLAPLPDRFEQEAHNSVLKKIMG